MRKTIFDKELAVRYGVTEAILLDHLDTCIQQERQKGAPVINGRTWVPVSAQRVREYHPYLSQYMVLAGLRTLVKQGVLLCEEVSKRQFRYAFVDEIALLGE